MVHLGHGRRRPTSLSVAYPHFPACGPLVSEPARHVRGQPAGSHHGTGGAAPPTCEGEREARRLASDPRERQARLVGARTNVSLLRSWKHLKPGAGHPSASPKTLEAGLSGGLYKSEGRGTDTALSLQCGRGQPRAARRQIMRTALDDDGARGGRTHIQIFALMRVHCAFRSLGWPRAAAQSVTAGSGGIPGWTSPDS